MATQRAIAKRQIAFQESLEEQMRETASAIQALAEKLNKLAEELHEVKLATLRVERKVKDGGDES